MPAARVRECLKCGTKFDSNGPGHRICPRCTTANNTTLNKGIPGEYKAQGTTRGRPRRIGSNNRDQ